MERKQSESFSGILDRLLFFKGIDETTLQFKRTYWFTTLGVSCFVALMFIPGFLFQAKTIILYGILLLSVYIPVLFLLFILPYRRMVLVHVMQHITILITFYCIVRLGGLHQSGGIILAGLSMVITSAMMFYSNKWSIWYFSFYMVCTLVVAAIQMRLGILPEMPSHVNHVFFLINTLCLSAYTLVIVQVYIKLYTQNEKDKANQLRALNEAKSKLYTNITHEFRTPLTVIQGMADQIEAQPEKWLKRGVDKIRQNSRNLLHLVNQMLDLARLEAGAMPRRMIHGDVINYLRILSESFHSLAESKHILLTFKSELDSFDMDYDSDKLSRIMSNLISNAVKYTDSKGQVTVNLSLAYHGGVKLVLAVQDTGEGIDPDSLSQIFDRFYRVEEQSSGKKGGSGLGLAITRELVHLLQGEIRVESVLNRGTTFRVELPVSHSAQVGEAELDIAHMDSHAPIEPEDSLPVKDEESNDELPILLIVEDNIDVTEYLHSLLEGEYKVEMAENGKQGIDKALEYVPDIILSDVMMPEIDGITMLGILKKDIRTSHIPVIMLTAKADVESRLEGLETGAEAYLEKPFNKDELFIRLRMLVDLRKNLRARYSTFIFTEPDKNFALRNEDGFMYKLHESFRNNLGNEEFGVQQLCDIMAMSRAQLYRKFKALTNRSIIDYLLSYRLHIARQLLIDSNLNVTQVAFEVGFKNLSHFSTKFHEEHGIKPSELKSKTTELLN